MERNEAKEILLSRMIVDRDTYIEAISVAIDYFVKSGSYENEEMNPRRAIDILRSANLVGILRLAADVGIEALEREMGGRQND